MQERLGALCPLTWLPMAEGLPIRRTDFSSDSLMAQSADETRGRPGWGMFAAGGTEFVLFRVRVVASADVAGSLRGGHSLRRAGALTELSMHSWCTSGREKFDHEAPAACEAA
jgi:hypothetical protein